jgi:MFS family permease
LVKSHVEESLGANPGDAALNPADSVAMGLPADRAPHFLASSRGRAFRALVHREYRLLFTAFLINQTGFWISHVSLQGLMADLTRNDPFQLGLLFFALFVPAFVLAPVAGVAADRFDRRRIMLLCYVAVALVTTALAVLTACDAIEPPTMLGIGLLLGTSFAFSGPASSAVAANSVPAGDLSSAVSLQSAANNLTRVFGPALAAPIIAASHYELAFSVFAGAALSAAVLTALMRLSPFEPEDDDLGILGRLRSGLAHARERHPAVPALVTVATLSLFGVSHVALLPVYAEEVLGSRAYFAWIVATTGVGAMIGALVAGYASGHPTLRGAALRMLGYAVALSVFATTTSPALALAAQFVIGYFYFSVMTNLQTLLQQIVDDGKRGRVMSLFQVAWAGCVPFGGLAMGAVAGPLGVMTTLLGASGVCAIYSVALLSRARRS